MKVFEFRQDMDHFSPWATDQRVPEQLSDRVPVGIPVGGDWVPLRGYVRMIPGLREGDFPYWVDPVFSERARDGLHDLLDPFGEWLPLETTGGASFFIFNVTTVIDCVDHEKSRFSRTSEGKGYAPRRVAFNGQRVDANCFRVPEGLTPSFYMLDIVVARISELRLTGPAPLEIWDSDLGARLLEPF